METTGCGTAIVTPFRADGSVDEPALWALVNWQIESGIDFIVACGSTGEAATLDEEEWLRTVRLVIDAAAGRVPVWAGCTHNSTRVLVRLAGHLRRMPGVAAVLSANPYYNKPTQEGQFQHFLALAREVDPLPVCVYNVPGRTAANLEPETVARLAAAARNIAGDQGSERQGHAVCRAGAHPAAGVQDFLGRRQPGAGGDRRGRARADQRGVERGSGGGDAHDSRRARESLGRGAGAGAAVCAAVRGELLGVESGAGEDGAEPDGAVRRTSASAAGAAHGGHARQAGAAGRRAGPAEACADCRRACGRKCSEGIHAKKIAVRADSGAECPAGASVRALRP